MTFYEAAVEVLREAGRPLNCKKITAQAIKRDLLSHVGKTPEDTMSSRLTQESRKPSDQTVIEEVRPGVFGLRAGVDLDDASETISLRAPSVDDVPEPDPVTDDAEAADAGPIDAPSIVRVNDEDDRRRRGRRSRRGGKRRDQNGDDEGNEDDGNDDDGSNDDTAADSDNASGASPGLPDIAAAARAILESAREGSSLSASKVANELARRNVGALGVLGAAGLRGALVEANSRRARDGRPPVFEETKPNFWTLATASASSLARSYSALDRWQSGHRAALAETVAERLKGLDEDGLGTLVTLLLDRMGYTGITRHDAPAVTISASSPHALTRTQVAVRIFTPKQRVGRDEVAALRGSLHQFNATAGIILALGKIHDNASEETDVPNVAPIAIVGLDEVADHLIRSGVGVASFSVDVSCLDDALFRELNKG